MILCVCVCVWVYEAHQNREVNLPILHIKTPLSLSIEKVTEYFVIHSTSRKLCEKKTVVVFPLVLLTTLIYSHENNNKILFFILRLQN